MLFVLVLVVLRLLALAVVAERTLAWLEAARTWYLQLAAVAAYVLYCCIEPMCVELWVHNYYFGR
jgi:hypothetical protein